MAHPTIVEPSPKAKPWDKIPPLHAGDRLSRFEFERRYEAHPEIKKAELIDGVVYMLSPIRFPEHAAPHFQLNTWLGLYCFATPGVQGGIMLRCVWIWKTRSSPMDYCAWSPT